jgi:hypothetical protein
MTGAICRIQTTGCYVFKCLCVADLLLCTTNAWLLLVCCCCAAAG